MRSDDELYRQFLTGDSKAYDELLIRHGDGLIYYLNGYLHNLEDAEDLMIEAFARIMAKRPAIREGGFKAYLYKTARNLASRFSFKKRKMSPFSPEDLQPEPTGAGDRLPEELLLEKERNLLLHRSLDRLDPQLREALWLVYMDGMSYTQAAEVMRVSTKKIGNLLSRGRKVLRDAMEKEGISHAHE